MIGNRTALTSGDGVEKRYTYTKKNLSPKPDKNPNCCVCVNKSEVGGFIFTGLSMLIKN